MAGSISKFKTGIAGFDALSRGGLPRSRMTLITGPAGCGKTMFGLQSLVFQSSRDDGEATIVVSFEEGPAALKENVASIGWEIDELEARNRMLLIDGTLKADTIIDGAFDLSGLLPGIAAKAAQIGAKIVLLDGIDAFLTQLRDPALELREIQRIRDWVERTRLTVILTAKIFDPGSQSTFDQRIHYLGDCSVHLSNRLAGGIPINRIHISKYRGSDFVRGEYPFHVGSQGFFVSAPGNRTFQHQSPLERLSTGFEQLDGLLEGGVYRGSSTLITGAPGTAKTTLAGCFLRAACDRKERALFVGFDESQSAVIRNLRHVGIDLQPAHDAGLLAFRSARIETDPEAIFREISDLLDAHKPACVVIDPISALARAGTMDLARSVAGHLVNLLKERSITVFLLALTGGEAPESEATELQVSTIADNWIHLTYMAQSGERNRALTIVKSRGTAHSNQVRELILTDDGPSLEDVYTLEGEVYMGTLRWQQEAAEKATRERSELEFERKKAELEALELSTAARIRELEHQLEVHRTELDRVSKRMEDSVRSSSSYRRDLRNKRMGKSGRPEEDTD